ncbi:cullin 1 protein-related [Cryptosporidium ryanae]|uniref:cullin 1 protein-related n=1 Tax=Cryptosporidium ryanae TaxID=515981 RepID=UPI003519EEA2|nr:cullin 1 protein-related [Cryptosporidium ryanae]
MNFDRSEPTSLKFSSSQCDVGFEERWLVIKSEAIEPLESYLLTRIRKDDNAKSVFTAEEYSRIYTLIYNMCTQSQRNWSRQLFLKYSETLENFLREKVLVKLKGVPGPELIFEFQLGWSNYLLYLHWMERFFGYLNKYYLKISGEGDLMLKGMNIFYDTIFIEIKDELSISFSKAVETSRFGNKVIDDEYLKEVVNICLELSQRSNILGIYENEIENILIHSLCSHYKLLADKWVKVDSLMEYLNHIQESLNSEQERCTSYLTDSTWRKFKKSLISIFLSEVDIVVSQQSSIKKLLFDNEFEQLKLLYSLLSSLSNGIQILSAQIKKYILECGQAVIDEFNKLICQKDNTDLETMISKDEEEALLSGKVNKNRNYLSWITCKRIKTPFIKSTQELLFVQTIMSLYDHLNYLLTNCFERDTFIQKAINESFEVIVNMDVGCHNQAQLICNYCDNLLKKQSFICMNSQSFSESDYFYIISTKIVELFSFIHSQDYFLEIYRYSLAKRLLQNQNTDFEKEELTIISLLKNKCGAGFTSKLEGMILDIQTNRELNIKYNNYLEDVGFKSEIENEEVEVCENNILSDFNSMGDDNKFFNYSKSIEFYVNVLTSSNWPTFVYSNINLPPTLKKYVDRFEEFYFTETDHRKLCWIHWYGQCIINYNKKDLTGININYEITCNTLQACILLLFNNNSILSISEIKNLLQIDASVLKKQIKSLTTTGILIMKHIDKTDDSLLPLKRDDFDLIFEINQEFNPVQTNIIIKTPSQGETAIKDRIEEDRSHAIEAAIVRIMKLKREMEQNELISHVTSQLEYIRPSAVLIINKINYLIEREYLSTHEEDPSKYIYVS